MMTLMFKLVGGGLGVMPDPEDNPDNHDVVHHDAGVKISFEAVNVGDAGGNATVGVDVDDVFFDDWESSFLDPGQSEVGTMRLGRFTAGDHSVLAFINPGAGEQDHDSADITVA